jgi:hypothetical protein
VNAAVHAETCAVPAERLVAEQLLFTPLPSLRPSIGKMVVRKVDRLSCVRFGPARYSVPTTLIGRQVEVRVDGDRVELVHLGATVATHRLVAPVETSIDDTTTAARHLPPAELHDRGPTSNGPCSPWATRPRRW